MATTRQRLDFSRREGSIRVTSAVLAALDHLTDEERDAVWQALDELEGARPDFKLPHLKHLPGEDSLYLLRPTPQVILFLSLAPDGTGEVRYLARPETLRAYERLAVEPDNR